MAFVLSDRIKETTTTTSTGTYTLGGAVSGFETFTANLSNGDTTYYCCTDGTDFEVGLGTFASSGTTLARTTIISSSNSNNAVNWSSGSRDIFCTLPGSKAVFKDGDGHASFADDEKVKFGSDNDGYLRHTGSIFQLISDTGGLNLKTNADNQDVIIQTDDGSGGTTDYLRADGSSGAVKLSHYGSTKLETTSGGVTITGALTGNVTGDVTGDVTGNVSGTAATVTGAAQSNITSVGTLTGLTTSGTINLSQTSGTAIKTTGSLSSADLGIIRASASSSSDTHGFTIKYMGSRTGNNNSYSLFMDNQTGTDVEAMTVLQDGKVGINNTSPSDTLDVGGDATITGDLTILSTDAGSGDDPNLVLYRNSSSPADDDNIGTIQFKGRNDNSQDVVYGEIQSIIQDASDGTEDSSLSLQVRRGGTATTYINLSGESGRVNIQRDLFITTGFDITFEGDTSDAFETVLKVADPTADRTVTLPDATGTVTLLTATQTLTNKTLTSPTINGFSGTGDASITGDLLISNSDADANADPTITLYRNSSSPAFDDEMGEIIFQGRNNNSENINYGRIVGKIALTTDGSEKGNIEFNVMESGTEATFVQMAFDNIFAYKQLTMFNNIFLDGNYSIIWDGATNNSNTTSLVVTDPTAVNTITLPDATGTVLTTGNSDTPTTTTSSSDADFVLVDDGGTMKKITPSNLGITSGGASKGFAVAMAIAL